MHAFKDIISNPPCGMEVALASQSWIDLYNSVQADAEKSCTNILRYLRKGVAGRCVRENWAWDGSLS